MRHFSIRLKFLSVISFMLATCVAVYLLIAIHIFKSDKTELVYDLNRSQVSNLASELDTEFEGISDKFKLYAVLSNTTSLKMTEDLFPKDSAIVYVSLYKLSTQKFIHRYSNQNYLETYGLKEEFFLSLEEKNKAYLDQILKKNELIWNATSQDSSPLLGYGRSIIVENAKGEAADQMIAIGFIRPDRFLKVLSQNKVSQTVVLSSTGELLIHSDEHMIKTPDAYQNSPVIQKILQDKNKISVTSLEDNQQKYLAALAKSYGGKLVVLTETPEAKVFSVVTDLIERSLIFSLILITTAFLAAILLSRSLTRPISELVDGMTKVSEGDLNTQINLKSRDETAWLAKSFNKMIQDLKDSRDKLEESNRELDSKVKERTLQLEKQNHAVKEAQEALLKTTRLASAGEIAGRAAHEVLNPLTSILTRLTFIEKRLKSEITPSVELMTEIKKAWDEDFASGGFEKLLTNWKNPSVIQPELSLWQEDMANLAQILQNLTTQMQKLSSDTQFLQSEGQRINKIISGMRKLSHIQSDKKEYSAHSLLRECHNIMADLFYQHKIELRLELNAETDAIKVDRDEFIQAVTNLMRNSWQAMQASQAAQKHLIIRTRLNQDKIEIEIEDNGVGIDPAHQEHLFESHFTTKSSEEGTGLGLGISRRFIRSCQGDIEFISSLANSATVFRISLPNMALHGEVAA